MIWNSRFWPWFLSLTLYVTALYSFPENVSSEVYKKDKETVTQSGLLTLSSVLNNGKSFLSGFKRQGSTYNPFLEPIIYQQNSIVSKVKGFFELYIKYTVFLGKRLCTFRLQYLVYPYHHHW